MNKTLDVADLKEAAMAEPEDLELANPSHEPVAASPSTAMSRIEPKPSYSQVLIGPFGNWTRELSAHVQKCSTDEGSWSGKPRVQ